MKRFQLLFLASAACLAPLLSQETRDSLPEETAATPTAARILGNIPDGTPPPPEPRAAYIKVVGGSYGIEAPGPVLNRLCPVLFRPRHDLFFSPDPSVPDEHPP